MIISTRPDSLLVKASLFLRSGRKSRNAKTCMPESGVVVNHVSGGLFVRRFACGLHWSRRPKIQRIYSNILLSFSRSSGIGPTQGWLWLMLYCKVFLKFTLCIGNFAKLPANFVRNSLWFSLICHECPHHVRYVFEFAWKTRFDVDLLALRIRNDVQRIVGQCSAIARRFFGVF